MHHLEHKARLPSWSLTLPAPLALGGPDCKAVWSLVLTTSRKNAAQAESLTTSVFATLRPKYSRSVTTSCKPLDCIAGAQARRSNASETLNPGRVCI